MMGLSKKFKKAGIIKWLLPLLVVTGIIIIIIHFFPGEPTPGSVKIQVVDEVFNSDLSKRVLEFTNQAGDKQRQFSIYKDKDRFAVRVEKTFLDKGTWHANMEGYQPVVFTADKDKGLKLKFKPVFGRLKVRAVNARKPKVPIRGMFKVIVGGIEKTGNAKKGVVISPLPPGNHLVEAFGIWVYPKQQHAEVIAGKTTDVTVRMEPEIIQSMDSWFELDLTEEEREVVRTIASIKLVVSPPGYDNIGRVLRAMGLAYQDYRDLGSLSSCDILFLNCGTFRFPDPLALKGFVNKGGCLYASDLTDGIVNAAFPGFIHFKGRVGKVGRISAEVMDKELQDVLGKTIEIIFDMGVWAVIDSAAKDVKVILRSRQTGKPLMVTFKYGDGTVFYTCFHNHVQASETERLLLQTLVLKQISAVSGVPVKKMVPVIRKKQNATAKK